MNRKQKQCGFIKMIIIFILTIATLAYFNVDVKSVIESKPVQATWGFTETLFTNYVAPAAEYTWNNILHDFIYENVVDFFTKAEKQISTTDFGSLTSTTTTSD
jgi:hypothetical protein